MKIVIDTGAIWHRIRRAVTSVFGISGWDRCYGCNATLTAEEQHYYAGLCERCEGIAQEQLSAGDGSGHA